MATAVRIQLTEHCDTTGGYNFEYEGRWLDSAFLYDRDATCAVSFTLPTEYLVEHGPAHVRALALELASELPFNFGYASFALVAPDGQWYSAAQTVRELRDRYPGLDIYKLAETSQHIGTQARGAYWPPSWAYHCWATRWSREPATTSALFRRLLCSNLPPLDGDRVLITLSEWPEAIDTQQQERPSPQLLALGHCSKRFLHEEQSNWFLFLMQDPEDMRRWIHRSSEAVDQETHRPTVTGAGPSVAHGRGGLSLPAETSSPRAPRAGTPSATCRWPGGWPRGGAGVSVMGLSITKSWIVPR